MRSWAVDCRNAAINERINGTLQAKSGGGTSYNLQNVVIIENSSGGALRERLTPPTTKEQENETAWNGNIS